MLRRAAHEAGDYQNEIVYKSDSADLAALKAAGMHVVEPDVAAFRKATADVCREPAIAKRLGKGFYDRLAATQK